jgi:hypothetical protein
MNGKVTWSACRGRDPDGRDHGLRIGDVKGSFSRAVLLLILASSLVVATDFLTAAVNGDGNLYGGGIRSAVVERSHWADMVLPRKGLLVTSRDFKITVVDDNLEAQAVVTTPATSSLVSEIALNEDDNSGDDFVNNVVGEVKVAEFKYGFTGQHHSWSPVSFNDPQLSINGGTATISVKSLPFRLYMKKQYVFLGRSPGVSVDGPDQIHVMPSSQIHVKASPVQVSDISGAALNRATDGDARLSRQGVSVGMTLSEGGISAPGWLDGLRGIGGIQIPVFDAFLIRLDFLFYYALVLWSLAFARRQFPGIWPIVVAYKIALTIVAALAAVAFLGFALDLSTTFFDGHQAQDYVTAGPLALLLGGTAVVWPIACAEVASISLPTTGWLPLKSKREKYAAARYAAIPLLYLLILCGVPNLHPLTSVRIILGTVAVAALVPCTIHQLLGRRQGGTVWLASAGTLTVAAVVTIVWPMLWYGSFGTTDGLYHVNAAGKSTYVVAAVLVVAGLSVLAAKAGRILARPRRAWWQWLRTAAVIIGISAAVLPAAVITSQVEDVHAIGLVPVDLFSLFDALPQLLDWALLVLAIMVLVRLPTTPDPRPAARRIAIPVGLMLLYWNGTWLYVPVIFLIGLLAMRLFVLPSQLTTIPVRHDTTTGSLRDALTGWRQADFAAGQSQALTASGTDALRDLLVSNKQDDYKIGLQALENAQAELAEKREEGQRQARDAKTKAFDYKGALPDQRAAKAGALVGAVLGIIPALTRFRE